MEKSIENTRIENTRIENPRIVCHIDGDKRDKTYVSVESLTSSLMTKYGLPMKDQVQYKYNGSSYDIFIRSKLGTTMRVVGFYYIIND